MNMNGKRASVDVTLGGALFADGAAHSIPSVPYRSPMATPPPSATMMFSAERRSCSRSRVGGRRQQSVTVPAGKFTTYKLELTSADGGSDKATLWIDKATRVPVKVSAIMAEMGGASMVSELVQ